MAKSRARGLFSRLQLYSRQWNGADSMKALDMVRFRPHSAVRVHSPSCGVIDICSRYFGPTSSDSSRSQLKRSDFTFASYRYQRSQQSKGGKKAYLWLERKPRAEFDQKMIRKALWVDGWSTPARVDARLKFIIQGRLQSCASYGTRDWSQDTAQGNRLTLGNNGKTNTGSTNATKVSHIVKGGVGTMHMHRANTTSEAVAMLKTRLQRGIATGSHTFVKVLQLCLKQKDFLAARQVHDCIIGRGMDKNKYVANALLNVYTGCERLSDARRVLDDLETKDVSWTMMFKVYAKNHHAESARELFNRMRVVGVQPDAVAYLSILKAFASPSALEWGKEVHAFIGHAGLESDVRVRIALIQMYAKCGCITEARRYFEKMTNRDSIT